MIAYIKGEIMEVFEDRVVILNNGIGYEVFAPVLAFDSKPVAGESFELFTYLAVKEDSLTLFGFENKAQLELFNLLLSVNGVGAKTALAIENTLGYNEITHAIIFGNVQTLMKVSGIGKKSAERILLELKDKVMKIAPAAKDEPQKPAVNDIETNIRNTAISALTSLGYNGTLAKQYVERACDSLPETAGVEEIITAALKIAARG